MKKYLLILCLGLAGCSAVESVINKPVAPATQLTAVQTLQTVAASTKAAMDTATALLKSGQITVTQWQAIANFYDNKFQPAFNLAVTAVGSDLTAPAGTTIADLATSFLTQVSQLTP